jgi:hypothetical protein
MKTLNILLLSLAVLVMMSCNKKEVKKGLEVKNNGLTFTEAYLTLDDNKTTANEFSVGDKIKFNAEGIQGYVEKDSMVYLGASLTVLDMDNKEVMNYPDLFSEYDATGVTPEQAATVTLFLTIGSPMKKGEDYIWKNRIWDKNGKGEITSETVITVK